MERRAVGEGLAVALVGCLLLPFVWSIPAARYPVIVVVLVGLIASAYFAVRGLGKSDPYDLETLREIHDREAVRALLEDEPTPDSDTAVCRNCGTCYPAAIGVCPECGCISGH